MEIQCVGDIPFGAVPDAMRVLPLVKLHVAVSKPQVGTIAARIAIMAMTTSNSMSVKAGTLPQPVLTEGNEGNHENGQARVTWRPKPLRFLRSLL